MKKYKIAKALIESTRKPKKKIRDIDIAAEMGQQWIDEDTSIFPPKKIIDEYKKLGSGATKEGRKYRNNYMKQRYGE